MEKLQKKANVILIIVNCYINQVIDNNNNVITGRLTGLKIKLANEN